MPGIFSEVLKALLADADKAFSGGVLGKAIKNAAAPPQSPGGATTAVTAALPQPPARAGQNVFRPADMGAGETVPLLKQILGVLESVARKIGILPKVAGAPPIREQISGITGQIFGPKHDVSQNTGGSAGYRFQQIAHQLAGKPNFKAAVPAPAAGGAGGGFASGLMAFGKLAGAASLVTGIFSAAVYAIQSFVTGIKSANDDLAKWNAGIAGSVANLEMTRMGANVQTAADVSPSAQMLNNEIGRLIEETQPLVSTVMTAANYLATLVVLATRIVTIVPNIAASISQLPEQFGGEMDDAMRKNKKSIAGVLDVDWAALGANPPGAAVGPRGRAPVVPLQPPAFLPPMDKPDRNRRPAR